MENPIKMDDLGVPLFLETPILNQCPPNLSLILYDGQERNRINIGLVADALENNINR